MHDLISCGQKTGGTGIAQHCMKKPCLSVREMMPAPHRPVSPREPDPDRGDMTNERTEVPDSTAVRTALWRAMHVQVDRPPHVLQDETGLQLAAPDDDWHHRPDLDPLDTRGIRAAVVARARFVEDLVAEQADHGIAQYVILGAGLDTFAQRRPELVSRLRIFEIDQHATQAWKRRRLAELGYVIPDSLHLVPVNFEAGEDWLKQLAAAGFDSSRPAVIVSTGVTMFLTKNTTAATLRNIAGLAPGTSLAMTFMLPTALTDEAKKSARDRGTRFISFYTPPEMLALAHEAGFKEVRHLPGDSLAERYFAGRVDGLRPASGEDLLLATT